MLWRPLWLLLWSCWSWWQNSDSCCTEWWLFKVLFDLFSFFRCMLIIEFICILTPPCGLIQFLLVEGAWICAWYHSTCWLMKFSARCELCGKHAFFTLRKSDETNRIDWRIWCLHACLLASLYLVVDQDFELGRVRYFYLYILKNSIQLNWLIWFNFYISSINFISLL